jgi:hypothetical protein
VTDTLIRPERGLYGSGMHDFIMDELELGTRVATALDQEAVGFGPLFDVMYAEYVKEKKAEDAASVAAMRAEDAQTDFWTVELPGRD